MEPREGEPAPGEAQGSSPPPSAGGPAGPGSTVDPKGKEKALTSLSSSDSSDNEQRRGVKRRCPPMRVDPEVTPIPLRTDLTPQSGSGDSTDMPPRKWHRLKK